MNKRIKISENLFIERKNNDIRSDEQIKKDWLKNCHNSKLSLKSKLQNLKFVTEII
jgi:hypothetical protein